MGKVSRIKQRYDENPFADSEGFKVPLRRKSEVIETRAATAITVGDEKLAVGEIRRITTVDSDPFVKLFTAELDRFFDLTPTALRITTILIQTLGRIRIGDGDQVYLTERSISDAMQEHGVKPPTTSTFYRSMDELIQKGFIAPSTQTPLYYINPAIFFNGDRVRFVTEIRKKKKKAVENSSQRLLFNDAALRILNDETENSGACFFSGVEGLALTSNEIFFAPPVQKVSL